MWMVLLLLQHLEQVDRPIDLVHADSERSIQFRVRLRGRRELLLPPLLLVAPCRNESKGILDLRDGSKGEMFTCKRRRLRPLSRSGESNRRRSESRGGRSAEGTRRGCQSRSWLG